MFGFFSLRSIAALTTMMLLITPASAVTITHVSTSINMDFVSVGNPNNVCDDRYSDMGLFGAVDYVYDIGKYEVSANQWIAVVNANTSDLLSDIGCWSGGQPAAHISWHEAAMFCNWLTSGDVTDGAYAIDGNGVVTGIDREGAVRLHGTVYVIPTEDEWYKAAYYDGVAITYYEFPTGSDAVPDGIDSKEDTEFDAVFWDVGAPECLDYPKDVDNAGALLSAYGTMGQGGNVLEWNETTVGSSRVIRGGYWYEDMGLMTSSYRYAVFSPQSEHETIGFRVARVPEPDSIVLLFCGILGSLIYLRYFY